MISPNIPASRTVPTATAADIKQTNKQNNQTNRKEKGKIFFSLHSQS